jgi:hypothetical protein
VVWQRICHLPYLRDQHTLSVFPLFGTISLGYLLCKMYCWSR